MLVIAKEPGGLVGNKEDASPYQCLVEEHRSRVNAVPW